jgi:pyruvate,water dikinase
VRSSATAEDLPGAAFAGQHDTYLNVVGEDAVRCTAAMLGIAADRACQRLSQPDQDRLCGCQDRSCGQSMINAEVAGVMLTADPVSGDRNTIMVDAATGLGEAAVSGLVTRDHYLLDDQGRIRHFQPGEPGSTKRLPDHVL